MSYGKSAAIKSKIARLAFAVFPSLVLAIPAAHAQTYPDRPIRVSVGFAAGSASDIVPRIILEKAAPLLGASFIIENQPGAGGAAQAKS